MAKKIFFFLLLGLALISFYLINESNYQKAREIKLNVVRHPENLPTPETAKNSAFGFANIRADFYWLQAIQYIGGNAIGSEYKKYLYSMLEIITELNPYFEHPYIIGELLLPSVNERYEDLTEEQKDKHNQEAITIGLKGMKNFCDEDKLELIRNEYDLQKIWNDEAYANPCKSYQIPFNLAFVYYFYLYDGESAAQYYKIASAHRDGLEGAKTMTAIMQGKGGDREKSFNMFLSMAEASANEGGVCEAFTKELKQLTDQNGNIPYVTALIQSVENARDNAFPREVTSIRDDEEIQNGLETTQCKNYVEKAIRELNLGYIDLANKKFEAEKGEAAYTAVELYEEGYLEFLPTDHQQYERQGIKYVYDDDFQRFDIEMQLHDEEK